MAGVSFSASAKTEVCRIVPQKRCCALAQCFGILLFCNSFQSDLIKIITESRDFAYILPKLFKRAFDVDFDSYPSLASPGKLIFQIWDPEKIEEIMEAFGFDVQDTLALHVNYPLVEEECCKNAFLRGAFLAGGSVTDPDKGYHMELSTTHQSVARETDLLIRESMSFQPKLAKRGGGQVLYLKQSEQISDFLTYLGAPVAAMGIMEARLEKELNNKVNRRCNCDDANISKVVEAAQEQLSAIRVLRDAGLLDKLPEKMKQAALAREQNPSASLSELAAMMEPAITKPAMNNRMKKLVQLAKETVQ
ncbi:MAG: DNA-binding protein WhiA [Oscillospiraceae bacterium]|nr:DNA-binding protein WhiA [Oscillospiraceae bacterium]